MYDARITQDSQRWDTNEVVLQIREERHDLASFLMADGTWQTVKETESLPEASGLTLPRGAVKAIAKAISEFLSGSLDSDTEAKVLREWLAVEQRRVDKTLGLSDV